MTIWGPAAAAGSRIIWLPLDEWWAMAAYWLPRLRPVRLLPLTTSIRLTAPLLHPNDQAQRSIAPFGGH